MINPLCGLYYEIFFPFQAIFYTAAHTGVLYDCITNKQKLLQGHVSKINKCPLRHCLTIFSCLHGDYQRIILWKNHVNLSLQSFRFDYVVFPQNYTLILQPVVIVPRFIHLSAMTYHAHVSVLTKDGLLQLIKAKTLWSLCGTHTQGINLHSYYTGCCYNNIFSM